MLGYRSFAHSEKGASHEKHGIVCQDYSDHADKPNMSIAAVADGHGSEQYFRSDVGSRFAVEAALEGIQGVIQSDPFGDEAISEKDGLSKMETLGKYIINTWREKVDEHEKDHPVRDDPKVPGLPEKYRSRYLREDNRRYVYRAYGSTLIAVAMTDSYWFGLHIGDGKCVVLYDDGKWEQPIPWDDKCFLNECTSICDDDAIHEFRYWIGPLKGDDSRGRPVAIFAGSDGVDDTFPIHENERHLRGLYRTVVLSFANDGYESASAQVKAFLPTLTKRGSGDDISIAGVILESFSPEMTTALVKEDELEKENEKAAEARKRADVKSQALKDVQSKADRHGLHVKELRKKTDTAELDYTAAKSKVVHQNDGLRKARKEAEEAVENEKAAREKYHRVQAELSLAEEELRRQKELMAAAEQEQKSAEAAALRQLENRNVKESQLQAFLAEIKKNRKLSRYGEGLTQIKDGVVQVVKTAASDLSGMVGIKKTDDT